MKVGIIHISDFHIKSGYSFIQEKIDRFLDSINAVGSIDDYVITFSGDLAFQGQVDEYKKSRYIIGRIIAGIKQKNSGNHVTVLIVPGNHDLTLTEASRDRSYIQEHYDNNTIDTIVKDEIDLLNNFYNYSHINSQVPSDKIIDRRFCSFGDYRIQFNLINTSLFSTLKPNDKELHYFPHSKMEYLKKGNNINLCVTIMHHSCEWFNWKYKSDLEKAIINNSELLLSGHDHHDETRTLTIENNLDTWISCAGEMNFADLRFKDQYNIIVIDTDSNTFSGYKFEWNSQEKIYTHTIPVENRTLQNRNSQLSPLPGYIKELKEDTYISYKDFTKYFVFPKLISEQKNEFGKREELITMEELLAYLSDKKTIFIYGSTNSGKSTLLKYIYCSIHENSVPLFLSIDSTSRIKPKSFIKQLFEEQYGDSPILYQKYLQVQKSKKILLVDGWDRLSKSPNTDLLVQTIDDNFGHIIYSCTDREQNIVESVEGEFKEDQSQYELIIKPFFTEKRNQLVRNVCLLNSTYNDEDIDRVNDLIDSLVKNNSELFSLNPGFIIRYTDYFTKGRYFDYAKGEAVFSKIFEFELQKSIIEFTKRTDVDEILIVFEEIAGYIFRNRNDILLIEEIRTIVDNYNQEYGTCVKATYVLDIGKRSKLFREEQNLSVYFANKNYLAYFIAKYLLRISQNDEQDYSGIQYALENICFGINSDIILFISYLSSNSRIVMSIAENAGTLLSPWEEINYKANNIQFLYKCSSTSIEAPSQEDHKKVKQQQEIIEESQYRSDIIEAKGLFEYQDQDINEFPYRIIRAIRYTEMICKALPAFNSSLKVTQKNQLIESIYTYPQKIIYAMLKPIDDNIYDLCNILFLSAQKLNAKKKDGTPYTKEDILDLLINHSLTMILTLYDHFSELCTSPKTTDLLVSHTFLDEYKKLQRLMVIENSKRTELLISEAEDLIKSSKNDTYKLLIKLVIRKHLLCNPKLAFSVRQQMVDKFFGKGARKTMLLPASIQ